MTEPFTKLHSQIERRNAMKQMHAKIDESTKVIDAKLLKSYEKHPGFQKRKKV